MTEYDYKVPLHLKLIYLITPIWISIEIDDFVNVLSLNKFVVFTILAFWFAWAVILLSWSPKLLVDDETLIIPRPNVPFSNPRTIRLLDIRNFHEERYDGLKRVTISYKSRKIKVYEIFVKFKSYIAIHEFKTQLEPIIHSIKVARVRAKQRQKYKQNLNDIAENNNTL